MLMGLPNKNISFGLGQQYLFDFKYEGKAVSEANCIRANSIEVNHDDLSTRFMIGKQRYDFPAPGTFNVYNSLAAIISAQNQNIDNDLIVKGLKLMEIAFGRGEVINISNISFKILLAKNPAGMNLVLQLLTLVKNPRVVFILNDKIADGRDVSWIWDSNFELLNKIKPKLIICSGRRVWDLILRIKYVKKTFKKISLNHYEDSDGASIYVVEDQSEILNFLKLKQIKGNIFLIPTYTSMLEFRKLILGKEFDEK
jgi:UDP-N-acetylmuramyl tripeptide synthase